MVPAATWKRNPLFRVLAFLDSCGVQSFELQREVDDDGVFLQPTELFADSTPIAEILDEGLAALRENVLHLFTHPAERHALLSVIGIGGKLFPPSEEQRRDEDLPVPLQLPQKIAERIQAHASSQPSPSPPPPTTTSQSPPSLPVVADEAGAASSEVEDAEWCLQSLPRETPWSGAMRRPASFMGAVNTIEGHLPLHLLYRLAEVLGVPLTTATESALLEQFLIDALDRWMQNRLDAENDRMILACGVQPVILEAARARHKELPYAVIDFVIDVVFPAPDPDAQPQPQPQQRNVLDWLSLTYEKNHEAVDVEEEDYGSPSSTSRPRAEENSNSLEGWQPEEGELVLTAENIDHYMTTKPSLIPHDIIKQKRKSWYDPAITRFELENHYTAKELRAITKEIANNGPQAPPSVVTDGEFQFARVEESVMRRAASATRKNEFVDVILSLHSRSPIHNSNSNASSSKEVGGEQKKSLGDASLSAEELQSGFSLAELRRYITAELKMPQAPSTKSKCAEIIVSNTKS